MKEGTKEGVRKEIRKERGRREGMYETNEGWEGVKITPTIIPFQYQNLFQEICLRLLDILAQECGQRRERRSTIDVS
jgi:hypothetical protein